MPELKLSFVVKKYRTALKYIHRQTAEVHYWIIADQLNISYSKSYRRKKAVVNEYTYKEVGVLLDLYGTPIQRANYQQFIQVRNALFATFKSRRIPMRYYQQASGIKGALAFKHRLKHPDSWHLDELEGLANYLDALPARIGLIPVEEMSDVCIIPPVMNEMSH